MSSGEGLRMPLPDERDQSHEARALLEIALGAPVRFGAYELLARLPGAGAAAVYEARDTRDVKEGIVALKRLESPRSPADTKRFVQEVRLTRSLGAHPNII